MKMNCKKSFIVTSFLLAISVTSCRPNATYIWRDTDGTIIHTITGAPGQSLSHPLPEDTEKWHYTGWEWITSRERIAQREPQSSYFTGNVFQIIIYDLGQQITGTGSGFVFNNEGWFITNHHVMKDGYFSSAIFDIPDQEKGESFTKLAINEATYMDANKDIFIGKIDNYAKISEKYYRNIEIKTSYEIGDLTYSIGYPSSSVSLKLHEGSIQAELSSIYNKVYSGVTYIGSTSFIAPGSSGGILVNANLEVLGMTTLAITKNDSFVLGGAIEAFNYLTLLQNEISSPLIDTNTLLHPEEKTFISFYKAVISDGGEKDGPIKSEYGNAIRYTYKWESSGINDSGLNYDMTELLIVDSDFYLESHFTIHWQNGQTLNTKLSGYYSQKEGLKNFAYDFMYQWADGVWYKVKSTNINYSSDIALTLNKYTATTTSGAPVLASDLEYAKQQFNFIYEGLENYIAPYK